MKSDRISWNDYFMKTAFSISERATCNRLKVGCVMVMGNRIIATGYNGSISGQAHCTEVGCLEVEENGRTSCKRTIHAEQNALYQCARNGIKTEGATVYVTHYPCPDCMKALNQAGVKCVHYGSFYQHRYENDFDMGMGIIPH